MENKIKLEDTQLEFLIRENVEMRNQLIILKQKNEMLIEQIQMLKDIIRELKGEVDG